MSIYWHIIFVVSVVTYFFSDFICVLSVCLVLHVCSYVLDGSAMPPRLEGSGFMKEAYCGFQKYKRPCSPEAGTPGEFSVVTEP